MKDGFSIIHEGQEIRVLPLVTQCVADLPAKAKIQNIKNVTGTNACGYCMHPGQPIKNPSNSTTIWYLRQEPKSELRTHDDTLAIMISKKEDEIISGIKGVSPLIGLNQFDIINSLSSWIMLFMWVEHDMIFEEESEENKVKLVLRWLLNAINVDEYVVGGKLL